MYQETQASRHVFDVGCAGIGDAICAAWIAEGAAKVGIDIEFVRGKHSDLLAMFGQRFADAKTGIKFGGGSDTYEGELRFRGLRTPRPVLWQQWMPFKVTPTRPKATLDQLAWAADTWGVIGNNWGPRVVLFPQSARVAHSWPYHKWHRLSWALQAAGWNTLSMHWSKDTLTELPNWRYGDPIEKVAALMATADCVVCNDSGPAHLAGTLDVPTFVIAGAPDPHVVFGHYSSVDVIRVSPKHIPCVGCHFQGPRFTKACDSQCEALDALPSHNVLEYLKTWNQRRQGQGVNAKASSPSTSTASRESTSAPDMTR